MKIEERKQLDALLLEETNVKKLARPLCTTEKGILELVYTLEDNEYSLRLNDETIEAPATLKKVLEELLNK